MRCLSCQKPLSDFESTRKYAESKKYVDLCNHCFSFVAPQLNVVERPDLMHDEETTLEEAYEDDYKFKDNEAL